MKNIVSDTACPSCRSHGGDKTGNHLMIFSDGGAYCNRCGYTEKPDSTSSPEDRDMSYEPEKTGGVTVSFDPTIFKAYPIKALPDRGITQETCEHYGVRSSVSPTDGQTIQNIMFPYSSSLEGEFDCVKERTPDKNFYQKGNTKDNTFFGAGVAYDALCKLPAQSRTLYVTEGEIDALSLFQTLKSLSKGDKLPPVVSLRKGSKHAASEVAFNKDLINKATKVVFVFDNDEPGVLAATEASRVLGSKAHVAHLSMKDANEMLLAGRDKELKKQVLSADRYMPASLVRASDIIDDILTPPSWGISYPWPSLTDLTFGLKPGLLIGVAAGTGIGKTDWFTQLTAHLVAEHGEKVGMFLLEAPPKKTFKILAGKIASTPFHRPDVPFDKDLLVSTLDSIDQNVFMYNHFGYKSWSDIKADIRTLTGYGYRYFIVDPLTALIAQEGEEYKALNRMMEEMASLTQELEITIFYASHLNQPERSSKSHEEGGKVKESQLTGSRAMIRWSHYIFGLERNKHAVDENGDPDMIERNMTNFVLLKDRENGRTGSFKIFYDEKTTSYLEPDPTADKEF